MKTTLIVATVAVMATLAHGQGGTTGSTGTYGEGTCGYHRWGAYEDGDSKCGDRGPYPAESEFLHYDGNSAEECCQHPFPSCEVCQRGCGGADSDECWNEAHTEGIYGVCDCDTFCDDLIGYKGNMEQLCHRKSEPEVADPETGACSAWGYSSERCSDMDCNYCSVNQENCDWGNYFDVLRETPMDFGYQGPWYETDHWIETAHDLDAVQVSGGCGFEVQTPLTTFEFRDDTRFCGNEVLCDAVRYIRVFRLYVDPEVTDLPDCEVCQRGCGGADSDECWNEAHTEGIYGVCDCDTFCDDLIGYKGDMEQLCHRKSEPDTDLCDACLFAGRCNDLVEDDNRTSWCDQCFGIVGNDVTNPIVGGDCYEICVESHGVDDINDYIYSGCPIQEEEYKEGTCAYNSWGSDKHGRDKCKDREPYDPDDDHLLETYADNADECCKPRKTCIDCSNHRGRDLLMARLPCCVKRV